MKKLLTILLTAFMLMTTFTARVFAEAQKIDNSNTTWELNNTILTIGGTGDMPDLKTEEWPWYSNKSSITSVVIGDGITKVGESSMRGFTNLENVSLPSSLETIGECAFLGCKNLSSITIPNNVTTIGAGAFQQCSILNNVEIPSKVTSIGEEAFWYCEELETIICKATTPPTICNSTFEDCHTNLKILVPATSVEAYKSTWGSTYGAMVQPLPLTIADIVPEDFPATPETGWNNAGGNGTVAYKNNNNICLKNSSDVVQTLSLLTELTKVDDNKYSCEQEYDYCFYVDNSNTFNKFTVSGLGTQQNMTGTYEAPATTFDVTYVANGATSGTAPANQTKTENVNLTLATNTGDLAKTGYTFAGWNTQANGEGDHYDAGATYATNAEITLYAEWAIEATPAVAKIGDTEYETLDGAISYSKNSLTLSAIIEILSTENLYFTANLDVGEFFLVNDYTHVMYPEGYYCTPVKNGGGAVVGYKIGPAVASITKNSTTLYYATLSSAVASATNGDTIVMLKSIVEQPSSGYILISSKAITIDLNGKTIDLGNAGYGLYINGSGNLTVNDNAGGGVIKNRQCVIYEVVNGIFTLNNGTLMGVDSDSTTVYAYGTININGGEIKDSTKGGGGKFYSIFLGNEGSSTPATLNVTGGTFGKLTINGTNNNNNIINITNGTFNNVFYLAGKNTTTISGGTFTSPTTAIELRNGTLNISGGSFESTANEFSCEPNASGATTIGSAIAIAQHTTKKDITVNITGGTFKGLIPINEANPQENDPAPQVNLSISDGEFWSTATENAKVFSCVDCDKYLSGGFFTHVPETKYIAPGYTVRDTTAQEKTDHGSKYLYTLGVLESGGNVVITETDNDVPKHYNQVSDLQAAIDNVTEANQEKFEENKEIKLSTITVDNTGGINAQIDDTVKIIANESGDNVVKADPGYKLNDPTTEGGKTTYTAQSLDIGKDYQDGDVGSGIKDSKQTATELKQTVEGTTQAVKDSAKSVNDTNANKQLETIVSEGLDDILAIRGIHQGTAAKALNKANIKVTNEGTGDDVTAAKNVNVFVLTYYDTEVLEDKTTQANKSYKLDITPMYQAYASTATSKDNMKTEGTGKDSVKIGDSLPVDCTDKTINLKIELPTGFITSTSQKVYVIHKTKTYNTTVTENAGKFYIEFTNPDGFSIFEITLKDPTTTPGSDLTPGYKIPKTGVEGTTTNNHSLLKLSSLSLLAIGTYLVIKKKKDNE